MGLAQMIGLGALLVARLSFGNEGGESMHAAG